jgi:hypothetical protein
MDHLARTRWIHIAIACGVATLGGLSCESPQPPPKSVVQAGGTRAPAPMRTRIPAESIPAAAMGMAGLETIALQISRGIQDASVRNQLAAAMRNPANRPLGIRLNDCQSRSLARSLFESGERHHGRPARAVCDEVRRRGQFALYMDPRGLARWGPSDVPAVTALADPDKPLPQELMAYRTPTVLANVGADPRRVDGPIIVVFPVPKPSPGGSLK